MKLLITGAWRADEAQINAIRELGHEIILMPDERGELPCAAEDIEGVICNGLFLYHPIEAFTKLSYIQLTSAGYDRVPMDIVKFHSITIKNARGVYSIPMAEFALCGVLSLYKQSRFFYENQKASRWEKHRGLMELCGKTVCIVGCGSVGTECAKRFSAFGCRVIGVDLTPYENPAYQKMLPLAELDAALSESDITVLTLPLTDETKHLMNADRFTRMKKGSVLVNIARGAIVDAEALMTALSTNLMGTVLDVFEEEPLPPESPLWQQENVILTPHNSFVGEGNNDRLTSVILTNLKECVR